MATMSVVQYQTSPQKLNVLQQSQNGNSNSREIIILRKPQQQQQQVPPQIKEVLITNTARKKASKGVERMTNPPPVAVARRNARERNRVKQVNNGFATLRQHIPNSIAAAFESTSGRGGNKKLSKVETLRMAVEYIRSLEDILAGDDGDGNENVSTSSVSVTSYISSTPSSPALTTATHMTYTYPTMSPSNDDDDISINPNSPHQYARGNYHIFYDDSENLDPIDDNLLSDPSMIDAEIELGNQDLSLLNSMHTTGSLSPEMYSDSSLSPISLERNDRQIFIPVFATTHGEDVKLRVAPDVMTDIKSEPPVISLPTDTDLPADSKENIIQVMAWWEQQQTRS